MTAPSPSSRVARTSTRAPARSPSPTHPSEFLRAGRESAPSQAPSPPSDRRPLAALVALAVSTFATCALLVLSTAVEAGAHDISLLNVAGWLIGAWIGLGLFVWVRSVNAVRSKLSNYVIPRWRPMWVASVLVAFSLVSALLHAWSIAEAWARR